MSEKQKVISELYEICVGDLITPVDDLISFVEKDADVNQVLSRLSKNGHVWVIDDESSRHVLGVITEADTLLLFAPPYSPLQSFDKPPLQSFQFGLSTTAEEIMTKQPIMTSPNEKIVDVIVKMKQQKIRQLPVVDADERLIGEITLHQLISEYEKRVQGRQ